jgi:multiple sugar transport system ATP-binding protein
MAPVSLRKVGKSFGSLKVLSGIDLDIADGEFVVLVGPSGCGKSTLLRTIAGLEEAGEGEIRIGGRAVNDVAPKDRNIAMVFQSYALYPHMDVAKNMGFSLAMRKSPADEIVSRVRETSSKLGLDKLLARLPKQLSGGQRQRVAMGRAIVRKPEVFLFDEPLSNLDAKLRAHMRTEIKSLHQTLGTTAIYVTHDQIEAMTMATRIVVLHDGEIQQIGPPLELYDRPANLFVAGFIGSPTMNFFDAIITAGPRPAAQLSDGSRVLLPSLESLTPGREITLGIRPEHLRLAPKGLAGTVGVVEPLGMSTQITLTAAGQQMTLMTVERLGVSPGDAVNISFDPQAIHVFDRKTSLRLS